ncbi:MAG: Gfo/Idh/MocA family oxidoreductase [Bryobacteraceae bacterium]|nr:Gfo/Idh/MocA family oxidoreductase [Bryobacteraceae bacterium]MDW8376540.1 Gfo/Idh/MocA family oxidoreductase [Bryobacterales bacterium]
MSSRRKFIRSVAGGLAGGLTPSKVLGANDRIRLGFIGVGERGMELAREAALCSNTEVSAVADVYSRRREMALELLPQARGFEDARRLLDDAHIDAVVIATPPHLHGQYVLAALDAGKHIYVERTLAFDIDEAQRVRRACQQSAGKLMVQVGHQACSSGLMTDALKFVQSGKLGKITMIEAHMFRNTPHGKPQWARPVYPDMTPEHICWEAFLGSAPKREFDAYRYANWRLFWDYSGGNVFENMSQQAAFWFRALNLPVPLAATMRGGILRWKDGREVPDSMSVVLEFSDDLLFSWISGFGNNQLGVGESVLGTDGTILKSQQIRFLPQKVNQPKGEEILGDTPTPPRAHLQNFLDAIRSGHKPNCCFELGYRVSVACRMAVESYRQQRTIRWDASREELI